MTLLQATKRWCHRVQNFESFATAKICDPERITSVAVGKVKRDELEVLWQSLEEDGIR